MPYLSENCNAGRQKVSNVKRLFRIVKELYYRYIEDDVPAVSAEMAYYFLLSVFPFMIFLITIIGYIPISGDEVLKPIEDVLPTQTYEFFKESIEEITGKRNLKLMSIGFLSAMWAASNGVSAIMHGINKAYNEKETRSFWKVKAISLVYTIALPLMILFYFVLLIFGNQIEKIFLYLGYGSFTEQKWDRFRYLFIITMMITVFASLYHFTPCKRLKWHQSVPGAVFTTVGWIITSLAFSYYVNNFWNLTLIYGSIGGIIALLVWLFISALLIVMGGEINAILYFENKEPLVCKKDKRQQKKK